MYLNCIHLVWYALQVNYPLIGYQKKGNHRAPEQVE